MPNLVKTFKKPLKFVQRIKEKESMFQEVKDHTRSMSHQTDYILKKRQNIEILELKV